MTHVKICSVQAVDHALAAADAGADFVGFNFVPGVRRRLERDAARSMVQEYRARHGKDGPRLVGIFADQPLEEVNRILTECGLDMAQLSGQEPISYALQVERPVIKAVHIPTGRPRDQTIDDLNRLLQELEADDILPLLDPHVDGALGGTGATFDWAIAEALAPSHRFLLAGGLTPDNVAKAVERVRPWGVDVSSGVETGGTKDPEKIRAFIQNTRVEQGAHE
ncbi:MAG: phosphoribosylanthranilate isomerase [Chloroflexi bacterium]|nr:phosphoribosylanthranilate isomerase [Chloroflexota bacterium]